MPETTARLRYLPTSPTKVRPVLKLIVGSDVMDARDTLRVSDRGVARELSKLLDSAIANAEHNSHIAEDELFVSRAFADEGPTLKRWRPRARGRGVRIRKRTSHVTIVLDRFEGEERERRRALGVVRGRPTRRARPAADEHDHDHDHEHDHEDEPVAKKAPAKKTAKKAAKTTKKTAKKSTTKKATTTKKAAKTTKKKSTKATKKSPRKGN